MKRFAIAAATVVVVLVAAGSAFAAINSYNATYSFKGAKGTASKPAALSFNQTITVTSSAAGERTGILKYIKTTIDGVKVDATGFPTCSASKINAANNDSGCNKKALIATGSIKALIGSPSNFAASQGLACDPLLHVWNGGKGKLIFFFVDTTAHACLGGQLHTGTVPPWTATYKQAGKNLAVTIPIPHYVDYPVAGDVGSLSYEQLTWKSQTVSGHHDIESTGCSGSKRKYTFAFNASKPGQSAETKTVSSAAACN